MKASMSILFPIISIFILIGCSTFQKNDTNSIVTHTSEKEGFYEKSNLSITDYLFKYRPFKEVNLENGLKIYFIQDNSLPKVSLSLLIKAGSLHENEKLVGLNYLTAGLLSTGTQTLNANQIADEFAQMGSSLNISASYDFTLISAGTLSIFSDNLLAKFSEVIFQPAFSDLEINRSKVQIVSILKKKIDNPSGFSNEKMNEFLFNLHPYGRDLRGNFESISKISKQDIIFHYLNFYRSNNASLAVVGKFDKNFEKLVIETFSAWTPKNIQITKTVTPQESDSLKVKLIIKKDLQQSQIRLSQLGIDRTDKDFLPLRLGNEILGGGFASRLNQKVRDDLGLTYSISSSFDSRKERGSFIISTFSKNETAGQAVDETLNVVNDLLKNGVSQTELQSGKNLLIGQFPIAIETPGKLAINLLLLDYYGISFDYLSNYNENIKRINLDEVNQAMRKHLNPKNFKVIVYGNETLIPQFEKYNPEIVYQP